MAGAEDTTDGIGEAGAEVVAERAGFVDTGADVGSFTIAPSPSSFIGAPGIIAL